MLRPTDHPLAVDVARVIRTGERRRPARAALERLTPLHAAARAGATELVTELRHRPADTEAEPGAAPATTVAASGVTTRVAPRL